MIKKTKTYEVLEEQDVEKLVSEQLGKPVKLSEMDITLIDYVPLCDVYDGIIENFSMGCDVKVDGEDVLNDEYLSPLDTLMPDQAYVDVEYIFAFSTDKFKSFSRETDSSD